MDKLGSIEIRVVGQKGANSLSPDNYDIRDIMSMLEGVEDLLYPNNKGIRPVISYSLESGSVRNIFKTSMQAVVSYLQLSCRW